MQAKKMKQKGAARNEKNHYRFHVPCGAFFASCTRSQKSFTCDLCGKESTGKHYERTVMGDDVVICKDCYDEIAQMYNS